MSSPNTEGKLSIPETQEMRVHQGTSRLPWGNR